MEVTPTPVQKGAPFLGVAAIDVDIPQMKAIMTGMFSGIMYAFMINNNGTDCFQIISYQCNDYFETTMFTSLN